MDVAGADFASSFTYDFSRDYPDLGKERVQVRGVKGKGYIKRGSKPWQGIKGFAVGHSYVPFKTVATRDDVRHLGDVKAGGATLHKVGITGAVLLHPNTIPYDIQKETVDDTELTVVIDEAGRPRSGTWRLWGKARVGPAAGSSSGSSTSSNSRSRRSAPRSPSSVRSGSPRSGPNVVEDRHSRGEAVRPGQPQPDRPVESRPERCAGPEHDGVHDQPVPVEPGRARTNAAASVGPPTCSSPSNSARRRASSSIGSPRDEPAVVGDVCQGGREDDLRLGVPDLPELQHRGRRIRVRSGTRPVGRHRFVESAAVEERRRRSIWSVNQPSNSSSAVPNRRCGPVSPRTRRATRSSGRRALPCAPPFRVPGRHTPEHPRPRSVRRSRSSGRSAAVRPSHPGCRSRGSNGWPAAC